MTDRPAPLTPADCDLRDFRRMMIDIPRLRASAFDATPDDAAWRAGVNLWFAGFHNVPAASLDDDEATQCKAAGLGRDLRTWRKVKAAAMRGWVLCSDGRWYHQTVAEFALEAWLEKLVQRLSSGAGNAKRWGAEFDPEPITAAIVHAASLLATLAPDSKALQKVSRYISRSGPCGTEQASHRDKQNIPPGSQETGTGTGTEKGKQEEDSRCEPPPDAHPLGSEGHPDFIEFIQAFPKQEKLKSAAKAYGVARGKPNVSAETLLDGAKRYAGHIRATKQELRFVLLAENWLAEEGWNDQYGAPSPASTPEVAVDPSWGARGVQLADAIGKAKFDSWFAPAELVDSDPPIIRFPKRVQRDGVARQFASPLRKLFGAEVHLEVRQ